MGVIDPYLPGLMGIEGWVFEKGKDFLLGCLVQRKRVSGRV
jgi:hypothetical protein